MGIRVKSKTDASSLTPDVNLQNNNLNLIQLLRGIASLLVVLFHTTINANDILKKEFCLNFFAFGGAGVDIFFVLSGFIITYTSLKPLREGKQLFSFLRRRFVRIFPSYWLVITLFLMIQILLPAFYNTKYNFTLSNILSTYFLFPGHTMINGVSWTLTYELFFYFLFSLVFIIPRKKIALVFSIIYGLIIILVTIFGYASEKENDWLGLLTFPMNTEFIMGILAAVLIPRIPQNISAGLLIGGSILFLTSSILSDHNYILFPNAFNRVIFFGVPSFFIIIGIVKFELATKTKVHNFLLLLGEASYSLYLLHLPIIFATIKIIARFNIQSNITLHCLLLFTLIIICWGSIFFYKYIEKPVIKKLNSLAK